MIIFILDRIFSISTPTDLPFQWRSFKVRISKPRFCTRFKPIGPTLFLVLAQDLNTLSRNNELMKFADYSTILVPENTDVGVATEFCHEDWAKTTVYDYKCKSC